MKILINCVNLLANNRGAGGAGRYVYSLIVGLSKVADIRVLVKPSNFFNFQKIRNVEAVPLLDNDSNLIHKNMSWSDVYLCPLNELTPNYIDSRVPVVSCILDLQHEVYPNFFREGVYEARRKHYGYAISRSNAVITISNHEKLNIQSTYGKEQVYVTYLAGYLASDISPEKLEDLNANYKKYIPTEPYVIYPAIPWRHKNHYRLIEAIWLLNQRKLLPGGLKLILTGSQEHNLTSPCLERVINDLNMHNLVELRGFVSDEELSVLIGNARMMVFPSLYEGFGIPLVDSMNFGTPVLTTATSSITEVCGNSVEYFKNPLDSKIMAEDIARLAGDECKLLELTRLGKEQGKQYSLEKTAHDTYAILEKIVNHYHASKSCDFVSSKNASYNGRKSSKRLTLILDCIPSGTTVKVSIKGILSQLAHLPTECLKICKFIAILPFEEELSISGLDNPEIDLVNIYSSTFDSSHYLNSIGYICDAVVDTDYLMYCSSEINLASLDISQAISTMDVCEHLTCVNFSGSVRYPIEIKPLEGIHLLKEFNYWKGRQLEFFNLKLIRTNGQSYNNNISTASFMSVFLSTSCYLDYPGASQP